MTFTRIIKHGAVCASLAAIVASAACSSSDPSAQFVAGFQTQVQVPRDLKSIVVEVRQFGQTLFCQEYPVVYDSVAGIGTVRLPQSLGTIAGAKDSSLPVEIVVRGTTAFLPRGSLNSCGAVPKVTGQITQQDLGPSEAKPGVVRILRRSVQQYVKGKKLYVPMPLRYACFDVDCSASTVEGDQSCKGGRCASPSIVADKVLREFTVDMINGTNNLCFRSKTANGKPGCMDAPLAPKVLDASKCLYEVQDVPNVPFSGVNVQLVFESGFLTEVLDQDPDEGFFIPDPTKPKQFQLAPGLCDAVKGVNEKGQAVPHPVTAVGASGVCPEKRVLQPLCADEEEQKIYGLGGAGAPSSGSAPGIKLTPSPTGLALLFDFTDANSASFAPGGIAQQLVDFALQDASLNTVSMGLVKMPTGEACVPDFDVPPAAGKANLEKIRTVLSDYTSGRKVLLSRTGDIGMTPALKLGLAKLTDLPVDRRAVVVIGNGPFDSATCNEPPENAASVVTTGKTKGIPTYVVFSGDASTNDLAQATALATAGGTSVYDARGASGNATAVKAFLDVATEFTTCRYDAPNGAPLDSKLAYFDKLTFQEVSIPRNDSCTPQSGAGWTVESSRIVMCKDTCDALRDTVKKSAAFAVAQGQSATPTTIYLRVK
jgi:hypothetical protein